MIRAISKFRIAVGILLVAAFVCVGVPAHAGSKVQVAWDKNTDFSKYRTYAWADHPGTTRPMVAVEIRATVDDELRKKGLTIGGDHPDLILNFHGSVDYEDSIPTSDPTHAASGGQPLPGTTMWTNSSVGAVVSVSKGSLVIDMRDASTDQSVWRGIAKGTLKPKASELQKQLHNSIASMFQDFPPAKSVR